MSTEERSLSEVLDEAQRVMTRGSQPYATQAEFDAYREAGHLIGPLCQYVDQLFNALSELLKECHGKQREPGWTVHDELMALYGTESEQSHRLIEVLTRFSEHGTEVTRGGVTLHHARAAARLAVAEIERR